MLAQPKLTSSDSARNYFENDTYYLNNEFEQGSFYGKLKEDLGLDEFNLADFDKLLMGQNLEGENLLRLTKKDFDEKGERKRAACDLTFASDKDVSILYEVADDKTKALIRDAFNRSIDKALDFAEENYSYTKDRNSMKGKKAENKMLFTRFDHSESRNDDMHLHVHALAMNMIKDENGNWRTVEFNQIMMNHQLIGQIQRNEFAKELMAMGIDLEISSAKNGTFKTKAVEQEVRDLFSTRSKQIQDEMEASGQTSYKATHTAQKQTAKWKDKNKDRQQIQEENIKRLEEAGADISKYQELKEGLEIRQLDERAAVEIAIRDLTDKKSVFSREDVLKHALKVGLLTNIDVNVVAQEFERYHELITIDREKNQFTTLEVLEKEEFIFGLKNQKNFSITRELDVIDAAIKEFEERKGFELKDGQNELAHTILSSENQYILAQGVAGAGKSTSLEIVNNVAKQSGIDVVALAPTGTATDNLAKEAGIEKNMTVAKFLKENGADIKDSLIIVDEAGMMGLRDTHDLLKIAEENNLKVVFSGDMNQKKSISQGDIFAGMQRQGFETVNLAEGNRQKTEKMKLAVKNILDRDIVAGLNILKDTTTEITDSNERLKAAKEEYLKDRDNSLLITTTNNDRVELNKMIRDELIKRKEITGSKKVPLRETINLSDLEKRSAIHYKTAQKVFLSKNIGSISAGREAVIKEVDIDKNILTIEHKGKKQTFTEKVPLSEIGDRLNLFEDVEKELGVGEKVIIKKNDKKLGLSNGQMGVIKDIKGDNLTIKFDKKEVKIDLKFYKYINHAYAITDFASQGKTTDKVIAVANSQAASFNDFYTQITRAKNEAVIITDNLEELQERAARDSIKLNAKELIEEHNLLNKENKMSNLEKDGSMKLDEIFTEATVENVKELEMIIDGYPSGNNMSAIDAKIGTSIRSKVENIITTKKQIEYLNQYRTKDQMLSKIKEEEQRYGDDDVIKPYKTEKEMIDDLEINSKMSIHHGLEADTYFVIQNFKEFDNEKNLMATLKDRLAKQEKDFNQYMPVFNEKAKWFDDIENFKKENKYMVESRQKIFHLALKDINEFQKQLEIDKTKEKSIDYPKHLKQNAEINKELLKDYSISKDNDVTTYTNSKTRVKLHDNGNKLSSDSSNKNDKETARTMIEVAKAKNWDLDKVEFNGSDEFVKTAEIELEIYKHEQLQKEQEKELKRNQESILEKIDEAHELYETVQDIKEFVNDDLEKLVETELDIEMIADMAKNYNMRDIDKNALDNFKELATEVFEDALEEGIEFDDLMHEAVKVSGRFVKQLAHTQEKSMSRGD